MSTDSNIRAETTVPLDEKHTAAVLDALAAYHPAIGRSAFGRAEVIITLPAETVAQAAATATAVIAAAIAPAELLGIDIATTADFDRRVGLEPLPELVSVTEAAAELGVTRQAVLQRIESGSLPATRIGTAWAIPQSALVQVAYDEPAEKDSARGARARRDTAVRSGA